MNIHKFALPILLLLPAVLLMACNVPAADGGQNLLGAETVTVGEIQSLNANADNAPTGSDSGDAAGAESALPGSADDEIVMDNDQESDEANSPDSRAPEQGSDDDNAIVSSDGTITQSPGDQETSAGSAASQGPDGFAPESLPGEAPMAANESWKTHRNEAFGFEFRHPANYIAIAPPAATEAMTPQPLIELWFQDEDTVQGGMADLEPPKLAISIYDNSGRMSVTEWLNANGVVSESDEVIDIKLANGDAVQVCMTFMMAPGCTTYLTRDGYVYQFTAMGAASDAMLKSLTFNN